jgi:transglutaminase-like putative cysteine protease
MINRRLTALRFCPFSLLAILAWTTASLAQDPAAARRFIFSTSTTLSGMTPAETARIWLPLPPENAQQSAEILSKSFPVKNAQLGRDSRYGNQMLYFEAPADAAGHIRFGMSYLITRKLGCEEPIDASVTQMNDYALAPDRLVPVGGKSISLLKGRTLPTEPMQKARMLYDIVDDHMQYRKDKPGWGRGDSDWACESGFGNCTDFHSLFISLARACGLPAKFQIGFSIPSERSSGPVSGYHCWAWFKPAGHGWVPVDISQANQHPQKRDYDFGHLDADRVAFTTGRDLILDPPQDGPPLNFFVFPYVEAHGEPYPTANIVTQCTYQNVSAAQASASK